MIDQHYTYRKAVAGDAGQLKNLGLLSYGQYAEVLGQDHWPAMQNNLAKEEIYRDLLKQSECFICEYKGEIVGMVFLILQGHPTAFFDAGWSYIRLLGIDPAHGGKGIGRVLTEQCIDAAKRAGETTLALHTSEFQNAARHIYENLGFKKLKELDLKFGKRYWIYTLDLNALNERLTYTRASLQDLEAIVDLRIGFSTALFGDREPAVVEELREHLRSYLKKSFKNNTSIWYLARHNGLPVGIGGLVIREQPGNFMTPDGLFGYIINMYTLPSFRRKGICGTILDLLVNAARREGVTAFELHATKEGEPVYIQHDFKIHHEPTYRRYI